MTRIAGTAVAPGAGLLPGDAGRAVTATIRPVGGSTGVLAGDAFYFDNLMFQLGNVPTEYFPRGDEILAGSLWESNVNVNVSKVMMDSAGLRGYDATGATFNLTTAGLLTLGKASPAARLEVDRTSFRYYNDSNALQFSIINGVLTTGALTGARVELTNLGLKAYNSGGTNTVAINTDGSAYFRGQIDLVNSTVTGSVGSGNIYPDSSAEAGVTQRTNDYGAIVRTAAVGRGGGYAWQATANAGGSWDVYPGQFIPTNWAKINPGSTYTGSAWGKLVSGTSNMACYFQFMSAAGATVGTGVSSPSVALTTTGWARAVTPSSIAPATAVYARLVVLMGTPAASAAAVVLVDDEQIEEGDLSTGWNPYNYIESNNNAGVSKVTLDSNGIRGYDATGITFNLNNAGLLTLGQPSPARRMEVDRTSIRFFTDSNTQNFSVVNGVLIASTATANQTNDTGARVRLDGSGLRAWNASNVNTVQINTDGTAVFTNMGGNNLVSNSNFMDPAGTGTWMFSGFSPVVLETGVDNYLFGTQGIKMTAPTGNAWIGKRDVVANRIPVIGGRSYTQSAYIKAAATNAVHNIQHYFYWYDNTGTQITAVTQTQYAIPVLGSWFRTTPYTAVAPANARYAGFLTHFLSTVAGEIYYIDGYQIEEGDMLTPWKPLMASTLSEVTVNAGVLTAGTLRGTTIETSGNVNVSKVMMDATGIRAYNAAGVNTVQINATGTAYFSNAPGGNLLPNSGGQVFPGQWVGYQGTLAQELTEAKFGGTALKLTVTTAPGQIYMTTSPISRVARVEPGKTYTYSVLDKGFCSCSHRLGDLAFR